MQYTLGLDAEWQVGRITIDTDNQQIDVLFCIRGSTWFVQRRVNLERCTTITRRGIRAIWAGFNECAGREGSDQDCRED